jgi:3-oxoacyl-[acyl-carrier-protein] synthase-3
VTAIIAGVGAALPERVLRNDFFARLGTSHDWIVKRTGIVERRWLDEDASLAELASTACRGALVDAGRSPAEVDHVVVATTTPDRITPGMAVEVAARLGAPNPAAFDLHAACAGFLYALDHATALVEADRARCVVVCGAEALSRITDRDDRATAALLGDGAGAVVVTRGSVGEPPQFSLASDGRHIGLLFAERDGFLRMRGPEVYEHAVEWMVRQTEILLDRCGMEIKDLDLFVAHQANARIVRAVAARLGLPPERAVVDIATTANISAASIPVALWRAQRDGRLRPGALVGLAAFGAGFVWGAGVLRWKAEHAVQLQGSADPIEEEAQ